MVTWKVPYIDLKREYQILERELQGAITGVFSSGQFILRDDVTSFEKQMADVLGVREVIGVNSGTDALYLAMRMLNLEPGAEIITSPFTFVATVAAIVHAGAHPVFADIAEDFNIDPSSIREKLTDKTRAIIPVHLNGRICNMDEIMAIARERHLSIIEDACQAVGASYKGRFAGSFGDFGCFSLHPMKILNAAGDGGFLTTDSKVSADKIRILRNHGQETKEKIVTFGFNSRLDNLQAAIVNVKLPYLQHRIERRRFLAARYHAALSSIKGLKLPPQPEDNGTYYDVYSSYVIRCRERNAMHDYLRSKGIEVFIHWPTPLHLQKDLGFGHLRLPNVERIAGEVLSLPIFPEIEDAQQDYVISEIKNFFAG